MKIGKNNEQNRMFLGLGVSRSVTFSRPRSARYLGYIVALFIVSALGAGIFFLLNISSRPFLMQRVSYDASLYALVRSPREVSAASGLKFWEHSAGAQQSERLYTNFVQQIVGQIFAENDPVSMISGDLELAQFEQEGAIATFELNNSDAWLAARSISAKAYNSEPMELSVMVGPLLLSLDKTSEKWFWQMQESRLFIFSRPDVMSVLEPDVSSNVADVVRPRGAHAFAAYTSDARRMPIIQNPYVDFLGQADKGPIALYVWLEDSALRFKIVNPDNQGIDKDEPEREQTKEGENLTKNSIEKIYAMSETAIKAYFGDLSRSDIDFEDFDNPVSRIVDELVAFSQQMYGIEAKELDKKSLFSNFAIFFSPKKDNDFSENDWVLVSANLDIALLEQFGLARFAQLHPVRVENRLSDGTIMIELRAETEGLSWEEMSIDISQASYSFKTLRAQGEENGYYVGSVDGLGAVLANSEGLLRQILAEYAAQDRFEPDSICGISKQPYVQARFASNFLFHDFLYSSVIDFVDIFSLESGDMLGCAVLHN